MLDAGAGKVDARGMGAARAHGAGRVGRSALRSGPSTADHEGMRPRSLPHARRWRRAARLVTVAALATALVGGIVSAEGAGAARADAIWVASWSTSPEGLYPLSPGGHGAGLSTKLGSTTTRNVVHPSLSGDVLRVHVTNAYGTAPLPVNAVTVGVTAATDGSIRKGTLRTVTFRHRSAVTVPAGAEVVSDPVKLRVDPAANLSVSVAVPSSTRSATENLDPQETTFTATGNRTAQLTTDGFKTAAAWYWVDGIDVQRTPPAHSVVALGDSLTTGIWSAVDGNARWTDDLARRLRESPQDDIAVVNAGISGNQLLATTAGGPSGVSRLSADVLRQAGVRTVFVLEGINDIAVGVPGTRQASASDLIAGYEKVVATLHAAHLRVIGATILPFGGSSTWTPARDSERRMVNYWILHSSMFDAAVNTAAAVADPAHPDSLAPLLDSGDHLHLSDLGYAALADAIPLGDL